jgi:hypothetical protein
MAVTAKESRSLDGGAARAASLVKSATIFGDGFEIDNTRASSPEEIAGVCTAGRGTFMGSTPLILMRTNIASCRAAP